MGHSPHLRIGFDADAVSVRDRLSRTERLSRDDGRTVLEAVVALSIIAASAAAWAQMATTAAHAERSGDRRSTAVEIATSEIEVLRATPDIERGADDAGGLADLDGLAILTDASGPEHTETIEIANTTFTIERFVLDPGSTSWRRIVVVVSWDDRGTEHDVRVDTAIPIIPEAATQGANLLVNGGFEFPGGGGPAPGTWGVYTVDGWASSRSDERIEVWPDGYLGVPASEGSFFVELNVVVAETLSQTVTVIPGAFYEWSIDHRGRDNDDTLEILIDGVVVATHTTAPGAWVTYSGTHEATASTLELGFRAVDGGGSGNLIDNARLSVLGRNVALGASASQSSQYGSASIFGPENAVDGNRGGAYPTDPISHTANAGAWLEIDLGSTHSVRLITIYNRTDAGGSRLADAEVLLGAASFGTLSLTDARAAATWSEGVGASPGAEIEFTVPARTGRYVRIQIPETGSPYLHIGEIVVVGSEVVT